MLINLNIFCHCLVLNWVVHFVDLLTLIYLVPAYQSGGVEVTPRKWGKRGDLAIWSRLTMIYTGLYTCRASQRKFDGQSEGNPCQRTAFK
jgi:hypothetical protein